MRLEVFTEVEIRNLVVLCSIMMPHGLENGYLILESALCFHLQGRQKTVICPKDGESR